MEEHVEEPIGGDRLAREAGVSRRQLERLARDQLGATLGEAYMRIRLAARDGADARDRAAHDRGGRGLRLHQRESFLAQLPPPLRYPPTQAR